MPDSSLEALKQAAEAQHGATATFAYSVRVREMYRHEDVWDVVVHVFDLAGHSDARRAYAWQSPVDDRRVYALLHMGAIIGPVEAVRAALRAEHRAKAIGRATGPPQSPA